jgi:hypothetical protein
MVLFKFQQLYSSESESPGQNFYLAKHRGSVNKILSFNVRYILQATDGIFIERYDNYQRRVRYPQVEHAVEHMHLLPTGGP